MTEPTKIDFRARRIRQLSDITEIVEMLFSGNGNQQHAAARILLALKWADDLVPGFTQFQERYGISRRTMQRTRAKLSRLGLIERIGRFNSRHCGREGWKLSSRFSTALRLLARKLDEWRADRAPSRRDKEEVLASLLRR